MSQYYYLIYDAQYLFKIEIYNSSIEFWDATCTRVIYQTFHRQICS